MWANYIAIGMSYAWGLDAALEKKWGWAAVYAIALVVNIAAVCS